MKIKIRKKSGQIGPWPMWVLSGLARFAQNLYLIFFQVISLIIKIFKDSPIKFNILSF